MFKRLPASLPPDASFAEDLTELGYFLTSTSDAKLRQIKHPEEGFRYKITNNDRYNDMHREAIRECIRKEVKFRMTDAGYELRHFPDITSSMSREPSIPIFTTPIDALKQKKRVTIVINGNQQDLGIWAWRCLSSPPNDGLEHGTCLGLVRELQTRAAVNDNTGEAPGLVILNPGQLTYSWKKQRAMTITSWQNQPRSSLVHPTPVINPEWNVLKGHEDGDKHVGTALEELLIGDAIICQDAEVFIIAIETGAHSLLEWLGKNLAGVRDKLAAVAFVCPYWTPTYIADWELRAFLENRCRSYEMFGAPFGTCIAAPYHQKPPTEDGYLEPPPPCPTFSSGPIEGWYAQEAVFPNIQHQILDWFAAVDAVLKAGRCYKNPRYKVVESMPAGPDKAEGDHEGVENDHSGIEVPKEANIDAALVADNFDVETQTSEDFHDVEEVQPAGREPVPAAATAGKESSETEAGLSTTPENTVSGKQNHNPSLKTTANAPIDPVSVSQRDTSVTTTRGNDGAFYKTNERASVDSNLDIVDDSNVHESPEPTTSDASNTGINDPAKFTTLDNLKRRLGWCDKDGTPNTMSSQPNPGNAVPEGSNANSEEELPETHLGQKTHLDTTRWSSPSALPFRSKPGRASSREAETPINEVSAGNEAPRKGSTPIDGAHQAVDLSSSHEVIQQRASEHSNKAASTKEAEVKVEPNLVDNQTKPSNEPQPYNGSETSAEPNSYDEPKLADDPKPSDKTESGINASDLKDLSHSSESRSMTPPLARSDENVASEEHPSTSSADLDGKNSNESDEDGLASRSFPPPGAYLDEYATSEEHSPVSPAEPANKTRENLENTGAQSQSFPPPGAYVDEDVTPLEKTSPSPSTEQKVESNESPDTKVSRNASESIRRLSVGSEAEKDVNAEGQPEVEAHPSLSKEASKHDSGIDAETPPEGPSDGRRDSVSEPAFEPSPQNDHVSDSKTDLDFKAPRSAGDTHLVEANGKTAESDSQAEAKDENVEANGQAAVNGKSVGANDLAKVNTETAEANDQAEANGKSHSTSNAVTPTASVGDSPASIQLPGEKKNDSIKSRDFKDLSALDQVKVAGFDMAKSLLVRAGLLRAQKYETYHNDISEKTEVKKVGTE